MGLALTDLVLTVPFGIYEIYSNVAAGPLQPWISWDDTHFNFSHVEQFPAVIWRAQPTLNIPLELSRWLVVVCALVFFAFFGFAEEARKNYKAAWDWIATTFRFRSNKNASGGEKKKGQE